MSNRHDRRAQMKFGADMMQLPSVSGDDKVRCDKCKHAMPRKALDANIAAKAKIELAAGMPASQPLPPYALICAESPQHYQMMCYSYCSRFEPRS